MKLKEKWMIYAEYLFYGEGYIPLFLFANFILLVIVGYDFNELKEYIPKKQLNKHIDNSKIVH